MEQTTNPEAQQPAAMSLFADGAISLAKAAHMVGLTRYEFAKALQHRSLPAYEYTETDYQEDLAFVALAND